MEREFWLLKLQLAIRQSLHTLKQNAEEMPLAKMSEDEESKKEDEYAKHNDKNNRTECNGHSITFNYNNKDNDYNYNGTSNPISVTNIDKDGKITTFNNLQHMKYALDAKIDDKVQQRIDRNQVFHDPNPWTYTVEEAAELDLLPEVPKGYLQKQRANSIKKYRDAYYKHRTPHKFEDDDNDDGSRLSKDPNAVEYHQRGEITKFTKNDLPKKKDEKKAKMK